MNATDPYEVNRGNAEHPAWEDAHWERTADVDGFHIMRLAFDGFRVIKHLSAIRSLRPNTEALEAGMKILLTHPDLTPDAKKLLQAAIEAQATGKRPAIDFWI